MSAQRTRNALPCPCLRTVLADPFRASRSPRFYRSCFMTQGGRFVDSCRRGSPAESAKRLIERCGCKPSVEGGEASLFRDHPKSFAAGRFGQLRHLMQATSDRPARILLPAPRSGRNTHGEQASGWFEYEYRRQDHSTAACSSHGRIRCERPPTGRHVSRRCEACRT